MRFSYDALDGLDIDLRNDGWSDDMYIMIATTNNLGLA